MTGKCSINNKDWWNISFLKNTLKSHEKMVHFKGDILEVKTLFGPGVIYGGYNYDGYLSFVIKQRKPEKERRQDRQLYMESGVLFCTGRWTWRT